MKLPFEIVQINTLAKEILTAMSQNLEDGHKLTIYSITKRINNNRELSNIYTTIEARKVKEYLKSNLKIKEIN